MMQMTIYNSAKCRLETVHLEITEKNTPGSKMVRSLTDADRTK